jgi:hypothetical protein
MLLVTPSKAHLAGFAQPGDLLIAMNSLPIPCIRVVVMRPSGCQPVPNPSHSPRQTDQSVVRGIITVGHRQAPVLLVAHMTLKFSYRNRFLYPRSATGVSSSSAIRPPTKDRVWIFEPQRRGACDDRP